MRCDLYSPGVDHLLMFCMSGFCLPPPARAADENSRILDRERAAMQAMGITVRLCDIPGRRVKQWDSVLVWVGL